MESPAEAMRNAVKWLVKHNYSLDDVAKVVGGNVIRVLRAVWVR